MNRFLKGKKRLIMENKMFLSTLFFLFFIPCTSFSLDNSILADIKKIRSVYEKAEQISLTAKVNIYNEKIGNPKITIASLKKDGMKFISIIGSQITVSNGKMQMLIDKTEKSVTVIPALNKLPEWMNNQMTDTSSVAGITIVKNTATEKRFSWNTTGTEYSLMEICFDPKTWFVKEVVYEYREPAITGVHKVHIFYTVNSINKPIDKSVFDLSQYVTEKGGKIKLTETYKNYTLYDQRKN